MDWGLANRLSNVIKSDGRFYCLAMDHGYFQGPTTGLEKPGQLLEPLLPHADALMCTRGVLRNAVSPQMQPPVVLRVSGGTSILGELSNEHLTTSMKEALRLNNQSLNTDYQIAILPKTSSKRASFEQINAEISELFRRINSVA